MDGSSDNVAAEVKGDNIFFHICRLHNSKVVPTEVSEDSVCLQIESLTFLYVHFKEVPLFEGSNLTEVIDGYIDIVAYINTLSCPINGPKRALEECIQIEPRGRLESHAFDLRDLSVLSTHKCGIRTFFQPLEICQINVEVQSDFRCINYIDELALSWQGFGDNMRA